MKPKLLSLVAVAASLLAYTPAQATPGNHFLCYQAQQATKLCWGTAGSPAACAVTDKAAGTCYGGAQNGVACSDPTDCDTLVCQTDGCPGGEGPCYGGFPKGVEKKLADSFGGQPTQDYAVKKPTEICLPADKNDEDPGAEADPEHLMAFQIGIVKGGTKAAKTNILVGDQFLNNQGVQVIKENRLLVPSSKAPGGPAGPFPANLDHYKCYKAKGLKKVCLGGANQFQKCTGKDDLTECPGGFCSPGFAKRTIKTLDEVNVDDQFQSARTLDVIKLRQVCFPVDKEDEGILDSNLYYTCYLVKPSKTDPLQDKFSKDGVRINNQLGNQLINVAKERELCLPAVKDPVVVTTTTTVVTTSTTEVSTTTTSTTTSTTGPPTTIETPCGETPYPVCNGSCTDMAFACVPVKGDGSLTTCFCQAAECVGGPQPACIGTCPPGLACEVQEGDPFDCTGNCVPQ